MATRSITPPFYPIIYVRGYAGSEGDIEDTVSDPYMGFNLGSTKFRQLWTGKLEKHYFESPLVRLMKEHDYRDVYSAGLAMAPEGPIHPRCIIIYRYYDEVSESFGGGKQRNMEDFGSGLSDLIIALRDRLCIDDAEKAKFRVYLIGHSMGGLVIRCFLQNARVGDPQAKRLVDKVFTYATPHDGIDVGIIGNVPAFFTLNSVDNFNRKRMATYLGLPAKAERVDTLDGKFDPDRFFCLIGTNPDDYTVARGWSTRVVGPLSDGLVRIKAAAVAGPADDPAAPPRQAPRAFVHRSHSGYFGIVNSEDGYQNLTRFLFGDVRVDGVLEVHELWLPPDVQRELERGREVRASYHFEAITRVRGASWDLSRRVAAENSAVFREFDELFPERAKRPRALHRATPLLFTAYLNAGARVVKNRPSLGFSVDLGVLVPEYQVNGELWRRNHYPGGYLFREKINLEAVPPRGADGAWTLRYGFDSRSPNRATLDAESVVADDRVTFRVPVNQKTRPGMLATLVLTATPWNVAP